MPGGVSVSSVESPEVCGGSNVELRRRPWRQLLAVTRLQLRVRRRHGRRLRLGELLQLPDYHVSQLTAGAPVLAEAAPYLWGRRCEERMEAMTRCGRNDHVLQAHHLGLLPGGPPTDVPARRRRLLVVPGDAEDGRELGDRRAPGVLFHRVMVVVERPRVPVLLPLLLVLLLQAVAVGADEAAAAAAGGRDGGGGGCAAPGAERRPGVAGGHRVGAVHVAVARQAQPRGVGPAVHHGRQAHAVVASRRLLAAGRVRVGHGFRHLRRITAADKTPGDLVGTSAICCSEDGGGTGLMARKGEGTIEAYNSHGRHPHSSLLSCSCCRSMVGASTKTLCSL
uniref:Uncharacterized protein n=1 Tax=Zea mays TaxID=4577 RepID=A0A804MTU5_MAIZE